MQKLYSRKKFLLLFLKKKNNKRVLNLSFNESLKTQKKTVYFTKYNLIKKHCESL